MGESSFFVIIAKEDPHFITKESTFGSSMVKDDKWNDRMMTSDLLKDYLTGWLL